MADAESIRQAAHVRMPFSTWLGVVLLFTLFGIIVLAVIGPSPRGNTYEQKRAKAREEKLKVEREENAKALTTYNWIDKQKGVVRIPIQRAMELTVTELAQKKPAPAGPIATPAVATSAVPTVPSPAAPKASSVTGPSPVNPHQLPAATPAPGAAAPPKPAQSQQPAPAHAPSRTSTPASGKTP